MVALPTAAFTASVLFDVLSLVADNAEAAHAYQRRAADLLRVGLGSSLAALGLEVTEYLRAPANAGKPGSTRKLVAHGAVAAIYLLDLAARQERAANIGRAANPADPLALALSLLGLAILGLSPRLER